MSLAEYQNNQIHVNFHLYKSLEICDKNSADSFWSKKDRGRKVSSLMPIRVKVKVKTNQEQQQQFWSLKVRYPQKNIVIISIAQKMCCVLS